MQQSIATGPRPAPASVMVPAFTLPWRMTATSSAALAAMKRLSDAMVTNWKPSSIILRAYCGVLLCSPAMTPCCLQAATMRRSASTTAGSS